MTLCYILPERRGWVNRITQNVSDKLGISQSSVTRHLYNLRKCIRTSRIVPHVIKILQNSLLTSCCKYTSVDFIRTFILHEIMSLLSDSNCIYGLVWVWFYDISIIVGYFMPNLVFTYILNKWCRSIFNSSS